MVDHIPRIEAVKALSGYRLKIKFKDEVKVRALYVGGLLRGVLAPLRDEKLFAKATVIDWGAAVGWSEEMDLSASTLWTVAQEQDKFGKAEFVAWQTRHELSNQEAADALGLSLSTIKNIRSGKHAVSNAIAIACRAMTNEPIVLAAHLIPRVRGRPKAVKPEKSA